MPGCCEPCDATTSCEEPVDCCTDGTCEDMSSECEYTDSTCCYDDSCENMDECE